MHVLQIKADDCIAGWLPLMPSSQALKCDLRLLTNVHEAHLAVFELRPGSWRPKLPLLAALGQIQTVLAASSLLRDGLQLFTPEQHGAFDVSAWKRLDKKLAF